MTIMVAMFCSPILLSCGGDEPSEEGGIQGQSENAKTRTFTANGVKFTMVRVDGGTFMMGGTSEQGSDAEKEERPIHQVVLSSYYIGMTEVTQALWEAVMGNNPSDFKNSKHPVEQVTWDDCQEFIKKLNALTRENFSLPTEAQWEFAARGGNKSAGFKFAGSNNINEVAWYDDNSYNVGSESVNYGTHDVATKKPNELGLFDMSGNVQEWCQDWYGEYPGGEQFDPTGPFRGSERLYRGGDWSHEAWCSRISHRSGTEPNHHSQIRGLRLALQTFNIIL